MRSGDQGDGNARRGIPRIGWQDFTRYWLRFVKRWSLHPVASNIEVFRSRCSNLVHEHASPKRVIDHRIHLRNAMEYLHTIVSWYYKRSCVGMVGCDLSGPALLRLLARIFLVVAWSRDRHRMPYKSTTR